MRKAVLITREVKQFTSNIKARNLTNLKTVRSLPKTVLRGPPNLEAGGSERLGPKMLECNDKK